MSLKSWLASVYARSIYKKVQRNMQNAVADQNRILQELVQAATHTAFGKDHHFHKIKNHKDFVQNVPIRDYEALKNYIERIKNGEKDVLWKGKPIYFAKTSGTTSGTKYIPITKASIPNHIHSTRDCLLYYIAKYKKANFVNGKMIFLSGSPVLEKVGGILTGRLSGIVNHHIPAYLRKNQVPTYATNCIEDWEQKVDKIVEETFDKNMTVISGIPPWMQMYFDKLIDKTGKKIADNYPNFSLMIYGGVNFEPYRKRLFESIGKKIDAIELFPASEGFIAFQDDQSEKGLLLNTNAGIFFEFVPVEEIHTENPTRLALGEVVLNKNYALIINNNAGLWGYNIGDTVKFTSLNPYRLIVSGRIKHFISAFGEHVISEEVEYAIATAAEKFAAQITEFTVAPFVAQEAGESYHEWFIEFEKEPADMQAFAQEIDRLLREKNSYYDDLITGNILKPLKITALPKDTFIQYMKSKGKLGGQNKLPRLSNDRLIVNEL